MSISERKQREKVSRREAIIGAAEKILQVKGFDGMTMDDVAVIAELGKGTIYLYFKNKIDLYHAVVCRGLCLLKRYLEKALSKKASGMENLMALGRAYYRFSLDHPLYFNAMVHKEVFEVNWEQHMAYEGVQCCERMSGQIFALMTDLIQQGMADGSLRSDLPPLKLSVLLWAQVNGVLKMTASKGDALEKLAGVSPGELLEFCFAMMRSAVQPPAAPRPAAAQKGGQP